LAGGVGGNLRGGRANAHEQVIKHVHDMTHIVFDVIAENKQKPHVAQHMRPTAVQKHGIKNGGPLRHGIVQKMGRHKTV
jgi:hypothetical protein